MKKFLLLTILAWACQGQEERLPDLGSLRLSFERPAPDGGILALRRLLEARPPEGGGPWEQKFLSRCRALRSAASCDLKLKHPDWSYASLEGILRGEVLLGMSEQQALAAWGQPLSRTRVEGGAEQLCYPAKEGAGCRRWLRLFMERVIEIHP